MVSYVLILLTAALPFCQVIAALPNVCNYLHMPAQSGSSSMLQRMKRGHTREAYDTLVQRARDVIPNVALSTDIITGTTLPERAGQEFGAQWVDACSHKLMWWVHCL